MTLNMNQNEMKIGGVKMIRITITVKIYTPEKIEEGAMKAET